jgi:hypothetical protein
MSVTINLMEVNREQSITVARRPHPQGFDVCYGRGPRVLLNGPPMACLCELRASSSLAMVPRGDAVHVVMTGSL